jgi:hypothetical protein
MREVRVYPTDDSDLTRPPAGRNRKIRAAEDRGDIAGNASLKKQVAEHEILQSQWSITQKEQEVQKRARTVEVEQMAARVANLEEELADVATQAGTVHGTLSRQRNAWRGVAAATGMIALAFVCLIAWQLTNRPKERVSPSPIRPVPQTVAAVIQPGASPPGNELPRDPHAALSTAIDRLNSALAADAVRRRHCGRSPETERAARLFGTATFRPCCTGEIRNARMHWPIPWRIAQRRFHRSTE